MTLITLTILPDLLFTGNINVQNKVIFLIWFYAGNIRIPRHFINRSEGLK